jgi:hypothetical protein
MMNLDRSILSTLQIEWNGVVQMRQRMDHLVISTFAFDPITSPVFGDILYNLPLLLAINVLNHVLVQVSEEGPALQAILQRGHQLAQEGRLLGDKQCLQDIADIEAKLLDWGVITDAPSASVQ